MPKPRPHAVYHGMMREREPARRREPESLFRKRMRDDEGHLTMDAVHYLRSHRGGSLANSRNALSTVKIKPGHRVMLIGDHHNGGFVRSLVHTAARRTPYVLSHIVPPGYIVTSNSPQMQQIISTIRQHKPDLLVLAFQIASWPARQRLFEVSQEVNPDRLFAAIPEFELADGAMPADSEGMVVNTLRLSRLLEASRGKEMLIETISGKREYYLKALIPQSKRMPIHCDIPQKGKVFSLPGGEAFFPPQGMHGEVYFPRGSVVGDFGVVRDGLRAKFVNNELRGVDWDSLHDKHIANRLLQRLEGMGSFACSEIGIGTHPGISLASASPLLAAKAASMLNLGFGKPRATALGNIRDSSFFNITVPKSLVTIGSKAVIETIARN